MLDLTTTRLLPSDQRQAFLARYGIPRRLERRKSDHPLAAIWRDLQRYAGLQRAKTLFGIQESEENVRIFCAYLDLADSFSILSEDAEMSLDPLLLYYGAMWLSRGVIAAKLGISLAASIKAHGARPLPSKDGALTMLGGNLTFHRNGTLPRLIQSLGGDDVSGAAVSIVQMLQALPEMEIVLNETLNVRTTATKVFVHPDILRAPNSVVNHIQVDFPGSSPELIKSLPISEALQYRKARIADVPDAIPVMWESTGTVDQELTTLFMRTPDGYFAESRVNDKYIPELAIYVAVLHALSEFTRYYPREWLDAISEHGADFALVREFMHFAERKVPELVLNELSGRTIVYGHA